MRQMRRMQAAVGTSWDQLGPVRTYQPCVTVDTAIQGISANGSKPGSKVKGKAKCHRSQQAALVGCRAEVDILNLAKGIDHKRPVTHAEISPQSTYCSHRMSGRGALAVLLCLSHCEAPCQQETTSVMGFSTERKIGNTW